MSNIPEKVLHNISDQSIIVSMLWALEEFIARMHGCVRHDSEMHETVLLDCTSGEAGSAIQ